VAYVYLFWENDKTVHWTIPVGLVIQLIGIPWEDSVAICQEQTVDREVTTYGKESVGLAIFGVGKP
jgi:hypothetical protein